MLRRSRIVLPCLILCLSCTPSGPKEAEKKPAATKTSEPQQSARLAYPTAKTVDVVDDFHGTKISDPYRWLEDTSSPETRAWIESQNDLTSKFLAEIPERERIRGRLEALWNYDKYGVPFREGDRYFFTKKEGLENQGVLFVTDGLYGQPRLLLDPNKLSEDGTTSTGAYAVTRDGKLLAYNISKAGSDWKEIRVRDVDSGKDLDDHLHWIKFSSASWNHDSTGFYYSRYQAPDESATLQETNYYQKLYFHRIGTPQDQDVLIHERPDRKKWGFGGEMTEDGRYLVIHVWEGTADENGIFYKDVEKDGKVVELLAGFDAAYHFIHNAGSLFYFFTDLDAPRGRVIAIDVNSPKKALWKEIIKETDATLESVESIGGRFVAHYLQDARSQIKFYTRIGMVERELKLPAMGSVRSISGKTDSVEMFYAFSSFIFPTTIYRYEFGRSLNSVFKSPKVGIDPDTFQIDQVFLDSKDGTRIPMFIAYKKGLDRDGSHPTYLYGYGGFNISLNPFFSVPNLVWMEMGGVFAMPNLRGGGEYGKEWHKAGMKADKQNVFDDFMAAARWLVANGYTSTSRLAIGGRSNGGLLVGACLTQQPELFGAVVAGVGVLDMLRFHKFTIGWAWVSDYGSPDNPEEFKTLHAYSPYHNVRPGTRYPATLVTTADHDDRVVPLHSFKFTAALQAAQAGPAPVLIRIDTRAGHGSGKPTKKMIQEWTDIWAFLARVFKLELPESFPGSS